MAHFCKKLQICIAVMNSRPAVRALFAVCFLAGALSPLAPQASAATSVWSAQLNFQEFTGLPGGFEAGAGILHHQHAAAPQETSYDILRPTGVDAQSGAAIFAEGQDGVPDLTIRRRVIDHSGGRWDSLHAGKRPGGYTGGATISYGTSRSGDSGLVALEFRFAPGLGITADRLSLALTSANGLSEAYEWTMITLGDYASAPFAPAAIASYGATDYSNLASGTFYNALGTPTGNAGTGLPLATGRSISQFLSGAAGSPVSGGLVQPGWFAIDDFNARIFDGPEAEWDNPWAEEGSAGGNHLITGTALGLAPEVDASVFTVWIGYHDIAFDSNGDGFTATDGNPFVSLASISIGSSIPAATAPEPSGALFLMILGAAGLLQRRR